MIIALWSAPRSRSTAFFRAMAERGDLLALHEPFCNVTDHGETDGPAGPVRSHPELIAALRAASAGARVFFKDTTDNRYPAVLADRRFLAEVRHTFLIRDPAEVAASFYAIDPGMCRADVGLEHLAELYDAAVAHAGAAPVVVDAADLAAHPAATMAAYCAATGLPFRPEALHWQAGDRSEWRRTAEWHTDVAASTGLSGTTSRYPHTVHNTPLLAGFAAHHRPYYERLRAHRLAIGA
ncbi:hypothetical protein Athai_35250 [Actinocatenispora thailandica]|uniref:Sulfotransferase family protein n=1 Tax=Actinocatenispora thailandica TaxID=227318 RepID=A0A7R7HXC2_9ACTN|nr:hypothetical protein [Actinocatenispora thailandica]BCJ36022.1 hypothetical protein Athai_35250 [Actinocatenispora thailandica]